MTSSASQQHGSQNRPHITCIALTSLDGRIAHHNQESSAQRRQQGWSPPADWEHLLLQVAQCDAVFLGARSLASERGGFSVAHKRPDGTEPLWSIWTQSAEIPAHHPFWAQEHLPKELFICSALSTSLCSPPNWLQTCCPTWMGPPEQYLHQLYQQGIKRVALLGGGQLNGFFFKHNWVDQLILTVAPRLVGCSPHAPMLLHTDAKLSETHWTLDHVNTDNDFLFLTYSH